MIARFTIAPRPPMTANSDILPKRSAVSCVTKCSPWRSDAFDSPACRSAKSNGTSATRRFWRARISSRILNPRGLIVAVSIVRRSRMKNPVIGSETSFSRIGNIALRERGRDLRHEDARAVGEPASGSSAGVARRDDHVDVAALEARVERGDLLGRMLQVAVDDEAHVALGRGEPLDDRTAEAARRGRSRWMSRTGRAADAATSRITSGVASVLSSTKMISASMPSTAAVTRRTSSATLGASLKVGTMIESCTALHRRMAADRIRPGATSRGCSASIHENGRMTSRLHDHDVRRRLVPRLRPHQEPARRARGRVRRTST